MGTEKEQQEAAENWVRFRTKIPNAIRDRVEEMAKQFGLTAERLGGMATEWGLDKVAQQLTGNPQATAVALCESKGKYDEAQRRSKKRKPAA